MMEIQGKAAGLVQTLPAKWYHDTDIYEQERQSIFAHEWLLFGHEAMVPEPGCYIAQTIAGWPLLVIRDKDGVLQAFHNVCRHRASMIVEEGVGKVDALRCMYHGWVYDTYGQLKKTPDFGSDEASLCKDIKIFSINLELSKKLIFVCLSDSPPDFEKALGGLPGVTKGIDFSAFRYCRSASHQIACNWKTYVENYAEGYHIPYVHPELNKEVDMTTYQVVAKDMMAQHFSQPRAEKKEEAVNEGLWFWLWPYASLNMYSEGMNLELMMPTGPETMMLQYHYFFKNIDDKDAIEKTIAMSRTTTEEDIKICEIVQKNLRAGIYDTGSLSPRHESGVAYFQDLVRKAIGESK